MSSYRYAIDVLTEHGDALGRVSVTPAWEPALAWVQLEGMRAGRLRPVGTALPGTIEPVWDATAGRPYVGSFRATVGDVVRSIPKTYLRPLALDASAPFVRAGALRSGEAFRWVVSAFPATSARAAGDGDFAVEADEQPLAVGRAALDAYRARSATTTEGDAMPVFVPQRVLDEVLAASAAAGDVETGGILVGVVHRDVATPELFLEVTAQIPAEHTRADAARLTFTAETWAAARDALALRARGEIMCGWYHFHPDFCRLRGCPLERRRQCTAAAPFFSAEDLHLHRACFGVSAHHVALLVSDGAITHGMTTTLFGWWQGMVVARGFHVLDATKE